MHRPGLDVEPLEWKREFKPWFKKAWKPGEHIAVIAPTGAGKSTLVGGLLDLRRYVAVLDPKGGDDTLAALDLPRLSSWPGTARMGRIIEENDEHGRPSRYLIGPIARTRKDKDKLRSVLRESLEGMHDMGGWTIYADELQILTDPRMFNLRTQVDEILIAARSLKISFIGSFQAPSWVTPHSSRQATWVAVSYTRDTDVVNRLGEILGRPKPEIRGALKGLGVPDSHSWIVVGRDPNEPLRVTIPDYIAPKKHEDV
jgi:hypothetical protein